MTKTINELVSELKEYDGELTVKVFSNGADKAYPISHVGQGHTDGVLDTYVSIVVDDDSNLVDLSKIWHDASEEPKKGTHILMEDDFLHSKEYKSHKIGDSLVNNWDTLKKFYRISRWAYIKELLPKGGEK